VVNHKKIIIDGKEFDGVKHLPPEARARYEEAMGKLDANRNGIPDFAEGMPNAGKQDVMSASGLAVSPAITPDTSNGWMLVLSGLFILFLCAASAGAVWYFFLR
jgi:hypothetical protein